MNFKLVARLDVINYPFLVNERLIPIFFATFVTSNRSRRFINSVVSRVRVKFFLFRDDGRHKSSEMLTRSGQRTYKRSND